MTEFIKSLFDSSGFLTRNRCGAWTPALQNIYIFSNLMIVASYFIIATVLFVVWYTRKDIMYSWMLLLFIIFLYMCGISHLSDVTAFWWAGYRFYTLNFFITGVVSIITAILLPNVLRKKLRLLSREEYHTMVDKLNKALLYEKLANDQRDLIIRHLTHEVSVLEEQKQKGLWFREQESSLNNLKRILITVQK
jgi:chemotaxis family two-component system sensor kinase Cph1